MNRGPGATLITQVHNVEGAQRNLRNLKRLAETSSHIAADKSRVREVVLVRRRD